MLRSNESQGRLCGKASEQVAHQSRKKVGFAQWREEESHFRFLGYGHKGGTTKAAVCFDRIGGWLNGWMEPDGFFLASPHSSDIDVCVCVCLLVVSATGTV